MAYTFPGVMNGGVRAATHEVVEQATSVARLAADDLKKQATSLALGVGFGAGASVLAVFFVGFAFATLAVALATFLATWLAMLIVTLVLLVATATAGLLARRQFKKGSPSLPEPDARERLNLALLHLREEFGSAAKVKSKIPVAAASAGFVVAGGLRAAARLARRR